MGEQVPIDGSGMRASPAQPAEALQEIAQAFLTLEQAISFYPAGHQARAVPLARLTELLRSEASRSGEASVTCAGESVLWRGAVLEAPPPVVRKFAFAIGSVGIARLVWSERLAEDDLHRFMTRLAAARGSGRQTVWDDPERSPHLVVEGHDYQSMMAAAGRQKGPDPRGEMWRGLLVRAVGGAAGEPSKEDLELLRESLEDPARLASLLVEVIGPAAHYGHPDAIGPMRRLATLADRAAADGAGRDQRSLSERLAELGRRLPAALRLRLLEAALDAPSGGGFDAAFGSFAPEEAVALLGGNFAIEPAQIERLTRVFQLLVPRRLDRMELAPLLRAHVPAGAAPDEPLADNVWEEVQELLTGEAGDFMSPSYRDQLRRLAAREADRHGQEAALAHLPCVMSSLAAAHTAEEALQIQFEQVRLATSPVRYRDAVEGLAGTCESALAAGDRERGLRILRRLLEVRSGEGPLAGPRAQIEQSLKSIASGPALRALVTELPSLSGEERGAVGVLTAIAPEVAVPVLLDALVAEQDPARRREIAALLETGGPAVAPAVLPRLVSASDAVAKLMLPLVAEAGEPATAPALLALLGRRDPGLRRDVLRTLLLIDSDEVRRALPGLLDDPDLEIVQAAAAHLGATGNPQTVRDLLPSLTAGRFSGRRAERTRRAIFVLGRMRAPEAVVPLGELLLRRPWINRRVQEQVSEDAALALARIGGDAARRALEQAAARGPERIAALCRRLLDRPGGG